MPRSFSLQRLMLAITLICIACGIAAAYPVASLAYIILLSLFTPTAIVCQVLVSLSTPTERMTTLLTALVGAFLGFLVTIGVPHMGPFPRTVWQAIVPHIVPTMVCPALGALILGGAALADDRLRRRHDQ